MREICEAMPHFVSNIEVVANRHMSSSDLNNCKTRMYFSTINKLKSVEPW